jgi:hypothetical protein
MSTEDSTADEPLDMLEALADAVHDASGKSTGNSSIMRIAPLQLGYLADGRSADSSRLRHGLASSHTGS